MAKNKLNQTTTLLRKIAKLSNQNNAINDIAKQTFEDSYDSETRAAQTAIHGLLTIDKPTISEQQLQQLLSQGRKGESS